MKARTRSSPSLGEFGNRHPSDATAARPARCHNQIPAPNRAIDNTTIWAPDFSQSYYTDLLFDDSAGANSMRKFYEEQSSNRYTVNGEVTGWGESSTTRPDTATTRVVASSARPSGGSSTSRPMRGLRPCRRPESQREAREVRHLGSLRLQRQRQLQRARWLHRPFPVDPRGRRRGDRRRRTGRRRDLESPLVRVLSGIPGGA